MTDRCRVVALSTNVVDVAGARPAVLKEQVMSPNYANPALDAELAYRRELLQEVMRTSRTRRGAWFRNRRRPR